VLTSQIASSHGKAEVLDVQQTIAACSHKHRAHAARALSVESKDIEGIAPCTPLQEGMISKSLGDDGLVYFGSFRYRLSKSVDLPKLRLAWTAAVDHIQILRTKFIQTVDGSIQVALHKGELPWKEISISDDSKKDEMLLTQQRVWREQNNPHFIRPFEIVVLETPKQTLLSLNIFHSLYDGNSLAMMLAFVYSKYQGNKDIELGPPFQDALAFGPLLNASGAEDFWTKTISTGQSHHFPSILRQPHLSPKSSRNSATFSDLQGLESVRKKLGVAHQAIMQACFAAVLQQYYDGLVPLGLVASGRSIGFDHAESVIGPMFNTIPFQIKTNSKETWVSMVERCHRFNIAALPFQHTPLRDIQKWCKVTAGNHLFDIIFVFQKDTTETADSDFNDIWELVDDQSVADYPLACEAVLGTDGNLAVTLVAQNHVGDRAMLQELTEKFHSAIAALIENPNALISETVGEVNHSISINGEDNSTATESDASIASGFTWSTEALVLRRQISQLSMVTETEISENVSIFELGLDSIDAIKLSSRLGKIHIDLPVSKIMRNPSIQQMVDVFANGNSAGKENETSILEGQEAKLRQYFEHEGGLPQDLEAIFPATPLQEAMIAEMMSSNFSRYYNQDVLKLAPEVDLERLQHAWDLIYRNSPILRTEFCPVSDPSLSCAYAQVVSKSGRRVWHEHFASEAESHQLLLESIRTVAAESPSEGNHFQLTLVHIQGDRFLVISLPHALYDGWSLTLLHFDVQKAYRDGQIHERPLLRNVLESIVHASTHEANEFWSDYLSELAPCTIPRSSGEQSSKVHRQECISPLTIETLRGFCKSQGITMQALGQTCWSLVLASQVRSLKVVFGVVLSGRDSEEAQDTMFPTMNTVPFSIFIHGTKKEMLRYTQDKMSEIRQFQHFPLRKAQALANTNGQRLFDSLFLNQVRPADVTSQQEPLYESVGGSSDVEYPVCVEIEAVGKDLIWRVACEDGYFTNGETSDLLKQLNSTLKSLVESPEEKVLSFQDNAVQVCDLPAFVISQPSPPHEENDQIVKNLEDEVDFTPTEQKIRSTLAAVSGIPENHINKQYTLFHIGLDSISAIKVSALLKKQSIVLSVSNMLKASTLRAMAEFVDKNDGVDHAKSYPTGIQQPVFVVSTLLEESGLQKAGLLESSIEQVFPATAGQVYMLSAWENSRGRLFYDEFKFTVSRSVAAEDISRGWAAFVVDDPIMRTIFVATGKTSHPFAQMVLRAGDSAGKPKIPSPVGKANLVESANLHSLELLKVPQSLKAEFEQPFARLRYHRRADGQWELGLKVHHALYDGVSLPALLSTLRTRIEQYDAPKETSMDTLPFAEFAVHSNRARLSEETKSFWTQYLQSSIPNALGARSKCDSSSRRFFKYKPKLLPDGQRLVSLAQKNGISVPSIFLAVYARLYASFKIQQDTEDTPPKVDTVVIGVYMANREHALEGLATSPTVNLLPLCVNTQVAILDSAGLIQKDLAQISDVKNVSVGLWDIAEWTGVQVDTFVNYLRLPGEVDEFRRDIRGSDGIDKNVGGKKYDTSRSESKEFELPRELRPNAVNSAYLVSSLLL
jgi:aryl carrier-like protein